MVNGAVRAVDPTAHRPTGRPLVTGLPAGDVEVRSADPTADGRLLLLTASSQGTLVVRVDRGRSYRIATDADAAAW